MNTVDDEISSGRTFPLFIGNIPFNVNKNESDSYGELISIISGWAWITDDNTTIEALKLNPAVRFMAKIPVPLNAVMDNYGVDTLSDFILTYRYPSCITPVYCELDGAEKFYLLTADIDRNAIDQEIHFDIIK